jgi:hypothetical protein
MKRISIVAIVANANVCTALQQQPHTRLLVSPSRFVQRGLLLKISAARIDQIGIGIEQLRQFFDAAFFRCVKYGIDYLCLFRRMAIALLELAGEKLDRLVPVGLGDLVDGAAVMIDEAGIEAGLQRTANRFEIAPAGGLEDRFRSF